MTEPGTPQRPASTAPPEQPPPPPPPLQPGGDDYYFGFHLRDVAFKKYNEALWAYKQRQQEQGRTGGSRAVPKGSARNRSAGPWGKHAASMAAGAGS